MFSMVGGDSGRRVISSAVGVGTIRIRLEVV